MSDKKFTCDEIKLLYYIQRKEYHAAAELFADKKPNVNARSGNITPMQSLMDFLTPLPQKLKKQNKKQYKKKLKNSAFDLLTDIHFFNLLVSNGLNLTTKDRDGQSYLVTAAKKGRTDMINSFVQVGMPFSEEDIRHAKQAARFNNYPSAEKYLGALESLRCQSEKKNLKQGGILPKIAVLGTILNNEAPRFEMLQKQIIRLSALDKVQNMYQ